MVLSFLTSIQSFNNQRYEALKKECQETGVPFSDPSFPADDSSLFYTTQQKRELPAKIVWKRPKDIAEKPRLFVDGASSCDVKQGMLGNCWFVAASSALAQEKELWNKVIPNAEEQDWNDETPDSYAGIFHFRFWRFGAWIDVVIDDRLPTIDGQLVYLHSREKNEFWGPLLEKAYAKVAGTYAALDGGNLSDALIDFSGGISETFPLQEGVYTGDELKRKALFKTMVTELANHSLMCAAIKAERQEDMEAQTELGLVKGHAYGITHVRKVYIGDTGLMSFFTGREKIYMVRLRNPWGGKEWNGPFSDSSKEWTQISQSERERIGLTFDEDGEFWMPFDEFCRHFTDMSICYMVNTSWFSFGKTWSEAAFTGSWTKGMKGSKTDRSGGCINHRDTFLRNPQFRFDVANDKDTVMLFLSQKDMRAERRDGAQSLVIGFQIMRVEENRRYRLHTIHETAHTSEYIRTRGVFLRCTMDRGRYVVIPTTFEPEELSDFYLRIFTSSNSDSKELTEEVPTQSLFPCINYPCVVTKVTVRGASGLEKQDRFGTADPYCILKCEGESVRSPISRGSLEPTWNISALFYRKHIDSPIKVQVWNSNIVMDSYMGRAVLEAPVNPQPIIHEADLFGRRRDKGTRKPGKVLVEVTTCDDLMSF